MTPLQGDYEPSPYGWVRDQVAEYEASGGTRANTLLDTGLPVVIVTTRGNKSGKLRKTPLMRVERAPRARGRAQRRAHGRPGRLDDAAPVGAGHGVEVLGARLQDQRLAAHLAHGPRLAPEPAARVVTGRGQRVVPDRAPRRGI